MRKKTAFFLLLSSAIIFCTFPLALAAQDTVGLFYPGTPINYVCQSKNPFYVTGKKHICWKCRNKLKLTYKSRVVDEKDSDGWRYDFTTGSTRLFGEVEFRIFYFECPECAMEVSVIELKEREEREREYRSLREREYRSLLAEE